MKRSKRHERRQKTLQRDELQRLVLMRGVIEMPIEGQDLKWLALSHDDNGLRIGREANV